MKLDFKVKDVFFSAHLLLGLATGLNFQFSPSPLLNPQQYPINLVTEVSSKSWMAILPEPGLTIVNFLGVNSSQNFNVAKNVIVN